jgi:hypothetical protein
MRRAVRTSLRYGDNTLEPARIIHGAKSYEQASPVAAGSSLHSESQMRDLKFQIELSEICNLQFVIA